MLLSAVKIALRALWRNAMRSFLTILGTVSTILVSAVSPEAIPEAQQQIQTLLHERHRIRRGQDDDFTIRNLADVAATASRGGIVIARGDYHDSATYARPHRF